MKNFNVELPLNAVSFGQVALNLLQEFYKKGLEPCLFPTGPVGLNCYNWINKDFQEWLNNCIQKANKSYSRKDPTFRLWHLDGANKQVSEKQILLTFHETDQITETEANIINNNYHVFVTSDFTKEAFESRGAKNITKINLGFDSNSFKKLNKQYFPPEVISFGLAGKLEHRKRHLDVLRLWARKYGNDRRYFLNCALFNQFLPIDQQSALINQALEGKRYYNINFNPFMDSNEAYNDYLNSNSIILGMSIAEGWGLPEFQSVALGKHGVILNGTGYKSWARPENVILVEPSAKQPIYDGLFFQEGREFNQGNGYTWTEESFYAGVDQAIQRFRQNPVNKEGLKLQNDFKWENTANVILEELEGAR